jgi:hypothetical protein
MPGASPPLVSIAIRCRELLSLYDAHDEQHDEDHDDQADPADGTAAPARAVTVTAAAEKEKNQNQDDQCSGALGVASVLAIRPAYGNRRAGAQHRYVSARHLGGKPRFPSERR